MTAAFYGFVLALTAVMRFAPDSPTGRLLNRQLVDVPLRVLGGMQRHHLIFVVLLLGFVLGSSELLLMLGSADAAVLYVLDLSFYIDGLMAALAMASLARTRSGLTVLRTRTASFATRLRRVFGRRRVRSVATRPGSRKASNDDDRPAFALAA
jgi:hypothetical protein